MDEPTGTTHTSNSSLSNLSILDNSTDDFGQQILEHARQGRDHRRLHDAVSGSAPAFSKARPKPGVALTLENLERNATAAASATSSVPVLGSIATPPQSLSSEERSTPSPNVPRQWGRKGRKKNDFLRRIVSAGKIEEASAPQEERSPDVLFSRRTLYTGDVDLGADDSADVPVASIEEEDEEEEVAPPPPVQTAWTRPLRKTEVDRLIERERDERLEFLGPPAGLVAHKSAENLRQQHEIESIKDLAVTKSRLDEIGENRALRRRILADRAAITSTSRDETPENLFDIVDDIKDAPVLVELEDAVASDDHLSRASISQRLNPRRRDSREVLRQLARASSSTPSSANGSRPGSRPGSRLSGKENDITPLPKTPLVTGAWVDTPIPTTLPPQAQPGSSTITQHSSLAAQPQVFIGDTEVNPMRKPIAPPHPRSALEAMIAEDREQPGTDAFGDTTIDSLMDIIGHDTSFGELDDETRDLVNNVGVRISEPNRERRKELKALHRMNEKLRVARAHIRDTSRGLERVENQVEAAEDTHGRCQRCGCSGNGATPTLGSLLWTAISSTFYTRSKNGRLKMTFLGLATLLFFTWLITEMTLCDFYCQPRYAYTMKGYGVDIYAPRMPYVTTTLMFRPFAFLWRPILRLLRIGLGLAYRLFLDQGGGGNGGASSMHAAASSREYAQTTGWSMSNDAYL